MGICPRNEELLLGKKLVNFISKSILKDLIIEIWCKRLVNIWWSINIQISVPKECKFTTGNLNNKIKPLAFDF